MNQYVLWMLGIALLLVLITSTVSGASTEVHIVLYAADGFTVLNETRVDYRWMEQHLPVRGDGTTHYYAQGPVFVEDAEERWNPEEDANVLDKDMGAIKGTDLRDLCELVGGMEPGDTVTLKAADGFSKVFAYENVYEPPARQGAMVITWYHANQSYVPTYADGMRLVFLADTSTNPWGIHAFGNYDWHESAEEEYWYYYYQEGKGYPTTTGLSVKYISEIQIWSNREPQGSISVTSNPTGARVWLDGTDTGYDTPCTLEELSEGYYSLTIRKNGYLTPDEQDVEVVAGKTVPVSFDLEPAAQGGGDSGSGDGGTGDFIGGTAQEILAGNQLSAAENLHINGTFALYSSTVDTFRLKGGEEHILAFDLRNSTYRPALIRLYLFLDASSADPGISTQPEIIVSAGSKEFIPVRSYSEESANGQLFASTLVYHLPIGNENGTYILMSRNKPSWNTTIAGALLLAGYEQEAGRESQVWICEGADLIGAISGQETPMTLAEFGDRISLPLDGNATILTGTTPESAEGNLSFYINGIGMSAGTVSGGGPVAVHEISGFPAPSQGGIRLHIATGGIPVTNRIAFLMTRSRLSSGDLTNPVQEITTSVEPTLTSITGTPGSEPATVEPVIAEPERRSDPIGNFLCWLLNLFLKLQGQPPEPCNRMPVQEREVITRETPESVRIGISSTPEGAVVFLDNQSTGLVTPCELDVTPGEPHAIGVEKDGYQRVEQQVTGPAVLEVLLAPLPLLPDVVETPVLLPARSHHGGIYITSYPEKAEIRIDGVVIGTSSPVLVTPLKEGFHTITAGIPSGTNGYFARQTVRTWVFPDAIVPVEFNLMDTITVSSLSVTSDSWTGAPFTVNGYYPVKRVPASIETAGNPAFITLTNGSSYLSFTIPAGNRESGQFVIPPNNPPVCNLSIGSVPDGAEIFLDGIRTGLFTPAVISNVSAGYHRISVTAPDRIPVTDLIHIAESQCSMGGYSVRYSLEWYGSGSISLISNPPGAEVSFMGLKTGEVTPCILEDIPLGVWEVTLIQGKDKRGIDVTVEPGKTKTYSVNFD